MSSQPHTSVPGMDTATAEQVSAVLEERLVTLLDLGLTLKHIHWNVVGPNFLSVHEMLDEQVAPVRAMADDVAERIRTLGGTPIGTPQGIVDRRRWDDYGVGRASVFIHLKALDGVYDGVIADHRKAVAATGELDPVTEDLLIGQTGRLEFFQWFVRSFVERAADDDPTRPNPAVRAADQRDARSTHRADREPTEAEAAAAERSRSDVDVDSVGEHYDELTSIGASTEGEGRI